VLLARRVAKLAAFRGFRVRESKHSSGTMESSQ
jgi:hypothetical protein